MLFSRHTDPQPPDVTNNAAAPQSRRYTPADRVNRYSRDSSRQSSSDDGMGTVSSSGRWKVSAKIQQLLNTLKRPKRRPLPEFYEDDDVELEIAANPKDPNAPRPEGAYMSPALGEPLSVSITSVNDDASLVVLTQRTNGIHGNSVRELCERRRTLYSERGEGERKDEKTI